MKREEKTLADLQCDAVAIYGLTEALILLMGQTRGNTGPIGAAIDSVMITAQKSAEQLARDLDDAQDTARRAS